MRPVLKCPFWIPGSRLFRHGMFGDKLGRGNTITRFGSVSTLFSCLFCFPVSFLITVLFSTFGLRGFWALAVGNYSYFREERYCLTADMYYPALACSFDPVWLYWLCVSSAFSYSKPEQAIERMSPHLGFSSVGRDSDGFPWSACYYKVSPARGVTKSAAVLASGHAGNGRKGRLAADVIGKLC